MSTFVTLIAVFRCEYLAQIINLFLFFWSLGPHTGVFTDVSQSPQLTPDEANQLSTWSRAAVATQTTGLSANQLAVHFLRTACDDGAKQQQRFSWNVVKHY